MKAVDTPTTWLLLLHQLPAKPAYLRVKTARSLEQLGAVPIKNAVHALPRTSETAPAYEKLRTEIIRAGGEALICEAHFVAGLSDIEIRALFDKARDADYESIVRDGRRLLQRKKITQAEVQRLSRRRSETMGINFFSAHGRQGADDVLVDLERKLRQHADVSRAEAPPRLARADLKSRVWVTRRHVHIDRIASAWLIRRFIDPAAVFKFVDAKTYKPRRTDLRFDMANAEFTHEGNDCTFETLIRRGELSGDDALRAIAEIIHDLDVDEGKFGRPEAAGFEAMISGVCASTSKDQERVALGSAALDQFYTHFENKTT